MSKMTTVAGKGVSFDDLQETGLVTNLTVSIPETTCSQYTNLVRKGSLGWDVLHKPILLPLKHLGGN